MLPRPELSNLEITASGQIVGKIKQRADCTEPVFSICDASGEEILKVKGPVCVISCCGDIDFEVTNCNERLTYLIKKVLTKDGQQIGKVTKQWSGLVREAYTDADNFGVSFPLDLDVRVKLTLMAMVFLIVSILDVFLHDYCLMMVCRTRCFLKKLATSTPQFARNFGPRAF